MSWLGFGRVRGPGDHVAARHVDVVLEPDGDRHRRVGLVELPVEQVDALDPRGHAAGQHDHLVARLEYAAGHQTAVAAVVVVLVGLRADDVLDREADVDQVTVGGHVDVLEVVQERRAFVPRHVLGAMHHVVALKRRDGDDLEVGDVQLGRELRELLVDLLVDLLGEVDEVHLVDAEHQVGDSQQREDDRVPAGLLGETLARVDEDQAEVGGGGTGDHVAGVLNVARGVGDDELAVGGGEVAVGHVDGDALLALGAQAVGQQGQIGVVVTPGHAGCLDGLELVGEDRLRVEQQSTDQGRLSVVDRAGCGEPEKVHLCLDGVRSRHQK